MIDFRYAWDQQGKEAIVTMSNGNVHEGIVAIVDADEEPELILKKKSGLLYGLLIDEIVSLEVV